MTTSALAPAPARFTALGRWLRFTEAISQGDAFDYVGTEDVVAALIDRSLVQHDLDAGRELAPGDPVRLNAADQAFRAAAPAILDRTDIGLFKDDEPTSHWWWRVEGIRRKSAGAG